MKPAPLFMFACGVAVIAGAAGGAAINTTPIQRAGIGAPDFMRADLAYGDGSELTAEPALPDHYDMITPSGRVEVAELTAHGLYSQQRFGWDDRGPPAFPEPEPVAFDDWPQSEPYEAPPLPAPPEVRELEQDAEESGARAIDVAAELADA